MSANLHSVDQRVAKIQSTLQQLANVMVLTARQDECLIAIERRVDRLEQQPVDGLINQAAVLRAPLRADLRPRVILVLAFFPPMARVLSCLPRAPTCDLP